MKVYNCPPHTTDGDRRLELFYLADNGDVEQYALQTKNEYSKDAWLRDIGDAMLAAGTSVKLKNSKKYVVQTNDIVYFILHSFLYNLFHFIE